MNNEVIAAQLTRIEDTVTKLWARVDHLERRASFWGLMGGVLTVLTTKLAGCM